jgi:hypothetical protein
MDLPSSLNLHTLMVNKAEAVAPRQETKTVVVTTSMNFMLRPPSVAHKHRDRAENLVWQS